MPTEASIKAAKALKKGTRSRLAGSIHKIASATGGHKGISKKAMEMLEDIDKYILQQVARAASSICAGDMITVTEKVMQSAFEIVFRSNGFWKKGDASGKAVVAAVVNSRAHAVGSGATVDIKKGSFAGKTRRKGVSLTSQKGALKDLTVFAPHRVGTYLRKYLPSSCPRIGDAAINYASGFIHYVTEEVVMAADLEAKDGERLMTKHIIAAVHKDMDLSNVVPAELLVRYHGATSGVKRVRKVPAEEPPKKKRRAAPKKKKAAKAAKPKGKKAPKAKKVAAPLAQPAPAPAEFVTSPMYQSAP